MIRDMNGQITEFIKHHYRHFNAAALIDAAEGYKIHLTGGGKMMITLAGAMSTAELGLSLAEMIRQDKVQIISCTGANLEEDLFNLVAHDFYERVPHYRDLTLQDEQEIMLTYGRRVVLAEGQRDAPMNRHHKRSRSVPRILLAAIGKRRGRAEVGHCLDDMRRFRHKQPKAKLLCNYHKCID